MKKEVYVPRIIDKAIFAILGMLMLLIGLYVVGPWYVDDTHGVKSPLLSLLESHIGLIGYGCLSIIDGIALLYATAGDGEWHTRITSDALLAGFLLRLYALFGVILTLHSWKPPVYLVQGVVVLIFGAMWVWVRVNAKLIQ